jgi:hypothetical protein
MCHEPTNISSSESDFTFLEEDHLPLTSRRSLLLSSERVSQRIAAYVPASNVDSVLKREEEDCFNELGVVSNCDATESVSTEILESMNIGCSQGLKDSGNIRPQNNILGCCSNAVENFNRVGETERSDDLEHLTLKERRKMLLERCFIF